MITKLIHAVDDISSWASLRFYKDPMRSKIYQKIFMIRREKELGLLNDDAFALWSTAKYAAKLPGDFAEVGTYQGASAKIICEAKGARPFHVFDTFLGLSDLEDIDKVRFFDGQFKNTSYDSVKSYLSSYPNVYIYKGWFPETATPVRDRSFALVNLDVDTYRSMSECINWFYPRMERGGVIFCHDYQFALGVNHAIDAYLADKVEIVLVVGKSYGVIIKI